MNLHPCFFKILNSSDRFIFFLLYDFIIYALRVSVNINIRIVCNLTNKKPPEDGHERM